jgi:hypothetical protein
MPSAFGLLLHKGFSATSQRTSLICRLAFLVAAAIFCGLSHVAAFLDDLQLQAAIGAVISLSVPHFMAIRHRLSLDGNTRKRGHLASEALNAASSS